jgi:hypothetical protein
MRQDQIAWRRCSRGGGPRFTPVHFGTIALYNDTQGAELLVVWVMFCSSTATALINGGTIQGSLGGTVGVKTPLVIGSVGMAGQVTQIDSPAAMVDDFSLFFGPGILAPLAPILPWAVLQPGWSFWLQDSLAGDAFNGFFIWESVREGDHRLGLREHE